MRCNNKASALALSLFLIAPACGAAEEQSGAATQNAAQVQSSATEGNAAPEQAAAIETAPSASKPQLLAAIEDDYETNLEALFKHFHANPELSFKESETAKRLAEELSALGYEVTEGVGGTGIVAVMENGDGKTVLLRADMDGLPVEEVTDLPYASKARQVDIDGVEKPVMHACGHDVHMTSLVGAARQLAARKDKWSGTLVLVGQPAEERIGGAKAMLKDGLYERFPKPDYALAFHIGAGVPAGMVGLAPGLIMSSADSVNITVRGVGTHGASPHLGVDPILVASHIVVGLQTLVSRTIAPLQPGVVTVGSFHGGFKHNVISDEVKLELTVRADDNDVRDQLIAGIERTSKGIAQGLGVPDDLLPIVEYGFESTPVTVNDESATQIVETAFVDGLVRGRYSKMPPRQDMGSEDFAEFAIPNTDVPGVYFFVGGTPMKDMGRAAGHHSPAFQIEPETSVIVGAEAMTIGALSLLGAGG